MRVAVRLGRVNQRGASKGSASAMMAPASAHLVHMRQSYSSCFVPEVRQAVFLVVIVTSGSQSTLYRFAFSPASCRTR